MGENELFCYTCSIGFSSLLNLKEHNLSLMHHKVYDHQMKNNGNKFPKHECFICNKWMTIDSWENHIRSKRHMNQLEQMRSAILANKSWTPPPPVNHIPVRGGHQPVPWGRGSRDSSASSMHSRSHSSSPVFGGMAWGRPMGPPQFRPQCPFPPQGYNDWSQQQFRPHFVAPTPPPHLNESSRPSLLGSYPGSYKSIPLNRNKSDVRPKSNGSDKPRDDAKNGPVEEKKKEDEKQSEGGSDGKDDAEVGVLLEKAQAMQDKFRKQREEAKGREEAEKKEEAKKPLKEIEEKLKIAGESNMKKMKGLIDKTPTPPVRSPVRSPMRSTSVNEDTHRNPLTTSPGGSKVSSEAKLAAGNDRQTLMNMISMPRSRRERRQVEDIIRKAAQRRTQRPRLQPPPAKPAAEVEEVDSLSATMMEVIRRHEQDGEELPTADLNLEDITSGVTSLSNTARSEEPLDSLQSQDLPVSVRTQETTDTAPPTQDPPQTGRSDVSSLSPAAKKRRVEERPETAETPVNLDKEVKTVDAAGAAVVEQSEEVTRMAMALELSVQEEDLKKKMKELDALIDDQKKIMDTVIRRIEELEAKKTKIRLEERAIHERRMEILKESYTKVVAASEDVSSMTSVTEQTESAVVDSSSVPTSSVSTAPTIKSEITETPTTSIQEDEADDEDCAPLIGNMTAREIRERAMAIIEGGAMSFGDLDDVLNELMRVSNTQDDSAPDTSQCEEGPIEVEPIQETQTTRKKKRRRKKSNDDAPDTSCTEAPAVAESVVSDVLSVRTSPRRAEKSKKVSGTSSPCSSEEQTSAVSTIPPISAFPGSLDIHRGQIHEVQLFRGQVYTCSEDGTVLRYNLQTHNCVTEYQGYKKAVRCMCVTEKPKGKPRVFSGGVENLLIVHDLKTGEEMQRLSMDAQIHCMHLFWFSLYIGLSNGVIVTYDVRKNRVISSRKVSSSEIRSLQATREGSRRVLVVACADGTISVRDVNSGNHMHAVGEIENPKDSLRVRVLGHSVYAVAEDGKLREFSIMGNSVKKPKKMNSKITSIFIQSNKEMILLGFTDGSVGIAGGPEESQPRVKLYYTSKRTPITALAGHMTDGNDGLYWLRLMNALKILAGNKDGQLFIIKFSSASKKCKTPGCSLNFEFDDDIVYHVTRDHVLLRDKRDVRCLWGNTCKHRYTKVDNEVIERHIRSHL